MNSAATLMKLRLKSVFFFVMVLILAFLSGVIAYNLQALGKNRALVSEHSELLNHASLLLYQELAELEDVMRLIESNAQFIEGLRQDKTLNSAMVADVFVRYGKVINNILQLRWLDESGTEKVRVNVQAGRPFIVPSETLQFKGDRYYFIDGIQVTPPQLYISPLDLNIEHHRIVVPYEPTIRISLRTGDQDGLRKGLLIINYNLGPALQQMNKLSKENAQLQLIDKEGFWIVHPDPAMCWGRDLQKPQMNLIKQASALWSSISQQHNLIGQKYQGQLISFQQIQISKSGYMVPDREFIMLAVTPDSIVSMMRRDAMIPATAVAIVIVFLGTGFVLRDYQSRASVHAIAARLQQEMAELKRVNRLLDSTLKQQQMLKDDLAESKRLSSLGMMVAGVSHEMNTPIGGALLAVTGVEEQLQQLQSALERGLTKSALVQFLQHTQAGLQLAEKNLEQANVIIKSFRRLTLARTGDEVLECCPAEIVTDLINGLTPLIKKRGIRLLNQVEPQLKIWTQPGILSQVLQNLVLNAVEHGFDEHTADGRVVVSSRRPDAEHIELVVSDNGKGIAPELMDTIFDPFVTSSRAKQHTGLGLHLVHQWVTQCLMGQVYSLPRQDGTAFVVKLPISEPEASL
jgi:signal transduction histidine kinase